MAVDRQLWRVGAPRCLSAPLPGRSALLPCSLPSAFIAWLLMLLLLMLLMHPPAPGSSVPWPAMVPCITCPFWVCLPTHCSADPANGDPFAAPSICCLAGLLLPRKQARLQQGALRSYLCVLAVLHMCSPVRLPCGSTAGWLRALQRPHLRCSYAHAHACTAVLTLQTTPTLLQRFLSAHAPPACLQKVDAGKKDDDDIYGKKKVTPAPSTYGTVRGVLLHYCYTSVPVHVLVCVHALCVPPWLASSLIICSTWRVTAHSIRQPQVPLAQPPAALPCLASLPPTLYCQHCDTCSAALCLSPTED